MSSEKDQEREIAELRAASHPTRRATVPALEEILYTPQPVLDHGFVRVVDYMGDDGAIVQAARVSYGRGTRKVSEDRGLIHYLMRHRHSTPFEMCEIKLHVKLPIFVARQWVRHRTANINEYSARYSILDKEFYVPDAQYLESLKEELLVQKNEEEGQKDLFGAQASATQKNLKGTAAQSTTNKQGREHILSHEEAEEVLRTIKNHSEASYRRYTDLLNEEGGKKIDEAKMGLARELARMVLPTNFYTQWYWKIDLHNLLHFLSLRADPHAQYEIRAYADVMVDTVKRWVPLAHAAFLEYRM